MKREQGPCVGTHTQRKEELLWLFKPCSVYFFSLFFVLDDRISLCGQKEVTEQQYQLCCCQARGAVEVTVEKRGQVGWSTSGRLCSCWELREPNGEGEQLNPQINRCCCCCFRTRRRPAVVLRCNKNPLVTTSPIDKHSHAVIHEDCDRAGGSNETGLFGTELSVVASDSSCVIVVELHSV